MLNNETFDAQHYTNKIRDKLLEIIDQLRTSELLRILLGTKRGVRIPGKKKDSAIQAEEAKNVVDIYKRDHTVTYGKSFRSKSYYMSDSKIDLSSHAPDFRVIACSNHFRWKHLYELILQGTKAPHTFQREGGNKDVG